jgi:DNA topoisomerase 2-associated protein PAT1
MSLNLISNSSPHPLTHFLHYTKGKRIVARMLDLLPSPSDTDFVTTLLLRLEGLDATHVPLGSISSAGVTEFMSHVMPTIERVVSVSDVQEIARYARVLFERHPVDWLTGSRVGVCLLTLLLSRAEISKSEGNEDVGEWYDKVLLNAQERAV